MKDVCTKNNISDFSARYLDTLCWYTTSTGKTLPVYISEITEEQVGFKDVHGNQYFNEIGETCQFDYDQIEAGWYVDPKFGPLYLTRRPSRQWKRGICSANTNMFLFDQRGLDILGFIDWSFETLARALIHTENCPSVLNQLKTHGRARLSPLIAMSRNQIFLKEHPVARVYGISDIATGTEPIYLKVTMTHPMFKQEVMDTCRDVGIQLAFEE